MAHRAATAALLALTMFATTPATATIHSLGRGAMGGEVATWQATVNERWRASGSTNPPQVVRFIRIHGYLSQDGVFGPLTERATVLYQRQLHLPASGTVGFSSWVSATFGRLTCCGAGYASIRVGDRSPYVTWWQIGLDRWLARHEPDTPELVPDGVFGPLTLAATVAFQRSADLPADGPAGQLTWARLIRTGLLHLP